MLEESRARELEVVGFRAWARREGDDAGRQAAVLRNYDGGVWTSVKSRPLRVFRRAPAGSDAAERAAVDAMYCFWFSTLRNNGASHPRHYSVAALKEADEGLSATSVPPYEAVFRLDLSSAARRAETPRRCSARASRATSWGMA